MSNDSPTLVQTQERLVSAIRSEISDAEETLSATADQVGEKMVTGVGAVLGLLLGRRL